MNSYRICLRLAQSDSPIIFKPESLFEKLPNHPQSRSSKRIDRVEATESAGGKTTNDWRFGPITIDWLDQKMSAATGTSRLSAQEKDASSTSTQRRKSARGAPLYMWHSQSVSIKKSSPAQPSRSLSRYRRRHRHRRAQQSSLTARCTSFAIRQVFLQSPVLRLSPLP